MKNQLFRLWVTMMVGMLFATTMIVFGQDPSPRAGTPSTGRGSSNGDTGTRSGGTVSSDVVIVSDSDYKLAPSDVIRINIEDAPELSSPNFVISKKGTIAMKYLGPWSVAGKTCEEVATEIADGLRDRYLKDPKVYVNVEQYNSRNFYIFGAVNKPGTFPIVGDPSLFKLLTIAGGLSANYGSTAYIFRETKVDAEKLEKLRSGQDQEQASNANASTPLTKAIAELKGDKTAIEGESEYEMITSQIGGLFRGRFDQNIQIKPGDIVYIPPTDIFFVAGEVKKPGQYTLREGTTLRQAIALAEGTFFRSATDRGIIFRTDLATGKLTEVKVDIGAVVNGKQADIPIMPNDLVMIPNSKIKTFTGGLAQALASGAAGSILYR